jgi:phage terminase large subunit
MIPESAIGRNSDALAPSDVRQAIEAYQRFAREKPIAYAGKCLGVHPWSKQRAILKAVADPDIPQVSVRSGNGVGKTYLASTIIAQYLDTHAPGYAVVTGASWQGVLKTVWPTFKRMHRGAPVRLGGEVLGTEWRRGDMWGAFCVSPDSPENISGFRTENGAMVLVDEASSLTPEVYEAILGVCSAKGSKIILMGNPLHPEGPFFDSFHSKAWKNFHISSIEASEQGIQGLASKEWIEARRLEWGEESMQWKARVLGDFPEDSDDVLIPLSAVESRVIHSKLPRKGFLRMGVDISRFGKDRTVILIRDDHCIVDVIFYTGRNLMETAGWVQKAMEDYRVMAENVTIDDTGLGGGVTDRLHELGQMINPVVFGESAFEDEKYVNRRTEMYWSVRQAIMPDSAEPLWLPEQFDALIKELTWPHYTMASEKKIALESKDKIKKRRGQSPDFADALALTYDTFGNFNFA